MKKFLIVLGCLFLVCILWSGIYGVWTWMKVSDAMPSINDYISKFYTEENAGNYSRIYDFMADPSLKQGGSSDVFERFLNEISTQLGMEKSFIRGRYQFSFMPDGTYFSVEYTEVRERGKTTEDFVLKQNKDTGLWHLFSYHAVKEI